MQVKTRGFTQEDLPGKGKGTVLNVYEKENKIEVQSQFYLTLFQNMTLIRIYTSHVK